MNTLRIIGERLPSIAPTGVHFGGDDLMSIGFSFVDLADIDAPDMLPCGSVRIACQWQARDGELVGITGQWVSRRAA